MRTPSLRRASHGRAPAGAPRETGVAGSATIGSAERPVVRQLLAPKNLLAAPAPARVLLAGETALALAPALIPVEDDGGPLVRDEQHGQRIIDAVVLGHGLARERKDSLLAQAHEARIPAMSLTHTSVVDVLVVNPTGWKRQTGPELGVLLADPGHRPGWRAVDRLAGTYGRERIVLLVPSRSGHVDGRGLKTRHLPEGSDRSGVLQQLRAVVDDAGLHLDVPDRAAWLTEVAARGVPLLVAEPASLQGVIHEPLRHTIAGTDLEQIDDPESREASSIRLRRAALRHHGAPAVWRELARRAGLQVPNEPSISVLLASNRPGLLPDAVERAGRQQHERLELIVALHADEVPPGLEPILRSRTDRPMTLLPVPTSQPLGVVLQRASEAASGDLVTKMDDDDLYDAEHVTDLVEAMGYSGATLVGKGSEYVYLEPLNATIRRFPHGAESANRNLAGGTLMIARDDLRRVGGWQAAPSAVDQRLIDSIERAAGSYYRTHGHGFVLYRRDNGHTWDQPVDYFLRQAVAQWHGLALDAAGVR